MKPRNRSLFQSIKAEIENKRRDKQALTRSCMQILDETIRPVIREAQANLETREGSMTEFRAGEREPYIRIDRSELRFICVGNRVDIVTRVNDDTSSDSPQIEDISEDLVVDKIAHFFRRVYKLHKIEGED